MFIPESKIKFEHTYWTQWIWKYLWQVIFQWRIQGRGPGRAASLISRFGRPSAPPPPPTLSEGLDRPLFTCKVEVYCNSFASNMIKLSVNETEWSSLLARTRALILYISIWKFDFGPKGYRGFRETGPCMSHGYNFKRDHFEILARGRSVHPFQDTKGTLMSRDLKPSLNENVSSEKLYHYLFSVILHALFICKSVLPNVIYCRFSD